MKMPFKKYMEECVHRTRMIPLPAEVNSYFTENQGA